MLESYDIMCVLNIPLASTLPLPWFPTVSSCITTYKKTPPPVPPRTTISKPFISITAQSSTESAQDAFMDGHGQGNRDSHSRGDMTVQSALSNSTESIDSMKALTAAIEAANAQVHGPASQHVSNSTITITTTSALAQITEDSRKEQARRAKCQLSIGIQVCGRHYLTTTSRLTYCLI